VSRIARLALVAAFALGGTLVAAAPANAAVLDVQCTSPNSTNTITFNPPLTLVNQPTVVSRATSYQPCRAPRWPDLVYGKESKTITILDDCTMVLGTLNVNFTILWNTGQTTTVSAVRTAALSGGSIVVTFNGTVTAGLFLGSNVNQVFVGSGANLIACLAGQGSVKSIVSRVQLTISH
jgi:hypothetical protein